MILRIPAFIRTIAHDINAATPTTVIGNGFFYHDKQHYISFHHLPFNHYENFYRSKSIWAERTAIHYLLLLPFTSSYYEKPDIMHYDEIQN